MTKYTQRDLRAVGMFALVLLGLGLLLAAYAAYPSLAGGSRGSLHRWLSATIFLALGSALLCKVRELTRRGGVDDEGYPGIRD